MSPTPTFFKFNPHNGRAIKTISGKVLAPPFLKRWKKEKSLTQTNYSNNYTPKAK